jgi:hypothetical protein
MKVVVLENKAFEKNIKKPIEIIAHIAINGKSMGTDTNFKKDGYDEVIIQKVNGEHRDWDCLVICKKHNSSVSVYTALFNDGYFE